MQIRRWALNAGIAGLALVIAGIAVASGGSPGLGVSVGGGADSLVALTAQGVWGVVLVLLGLVTLLWTVAWTLGNNAHRPATSVEE